MRQHIAGRQSFSLRQAAVILRSSLGSIQQIGSDHLLQVTRSLFDLCPAWSPDGRYLAFSRYGEQEQSII
jgi:Tol biopolymer transport system component